MGKKRRATIETGLDEPVVKKKNGNQLNATENVLGSWSVTDAMLLLKKISAHLPKVDQVSYVRRENSLDWEAVKFGSHSAAGCKAMWQKINSKIRKIRSMSELLEEITSTDIGSYLFHVMGPPKPGNPANVYLKENYSKYKQKHPQLSNTTCFSRISQKFRSLSDEKKKKLTEKLDVEKLEYKEKKEQFTKLCRKEMKELSDAEVTIEERAEANVKKEQKELTKQSMQPKKPWNSYNLFYDSCKHDMMNIPGKERSVKIRQLWKELPESERSEHIQNSKMAIKKYKLELQQYIDTLPPEEQEEAKAKLFKVKEKNGKLEKDQTTIGDHLNAKKNKLQNSKPQQQDKQDEEPVPNQSSESESSDKEEEMKSPIKKKDRKQEGKKLANVKDSSVKGNKAKSSVKLLVNKKDESSGDSSDSSDEETQIKPSQKTHMLSTNSAIAKHSKHPRIVQKDSNGSNSKNMKENKASKSSVNKKDESSESSSDSSDEETQIKSPSKNTHLLSPPKSHVKNASIAKKDTSNFQNVKENKVQSSVKSPVKRKVAESSDSSSSDSSDDETQKKSTSKKTHTIAKSKVKKDTSNSRTVKENKAKSSVKSPVKRKVVESSESSSSDSSDEETQKKSPSKTVQVKKDSSGNNSQTVKENKTKPPTRSPVKKKVAESSDSDSSDGSD